MFSLHMVMVPWFSLLYFTCCDMLSCMSLILRHGVLNSKLNVNLVNTKCDLITLHNINKIIICLVIQWGT
jgi:hypothetical protein